MDIEKKKRKLNWKFWKQSGLIGLNRLTEHGYQKQVNINLKQLQKKIKHFFLRFSLKCTLVLHSFIKYVFLSIIKSYR